MGMLDWLLRRDPIKTQGEAAQTKSGKAAYKLAQEIVETEDTNRWKEMMDLYYKTVKPDAKVEVLLLATALANKMNVAGWKREVQAKREQLEKQGYL